LSANLAKIFEGAFASALISYSQMVELPRIRTWQAIDADGRWTADSDNTVPLIDIRCSPPVVDEGGRTWLCKLTILAATDAADDQTHAEISGYYEQIQGVVDALYGQYITRPTSSPEKTAFEAYITNQFSTQSFTIHVGGLKYGEPATPIIDGGKNIIGLEVEIHYSRSDT
jgi:hypothetical protein